MQANLYQFVRTAAESFVLGGPVYEFGFGPRDCSWVLAVRNSFPNALYLGCELHADILREHPDRFARLPFANGAARTVICFDVFEQLPDPSLALSELIRVLRPGGAFLVGASIEKLQAGGQTDYLHPRFLREILASLEVSLVGWQGAIDDPRAIFGIGFKPPTPDVVLAGMQPFLKRISQRLSGQNSWPWRLAGAVATRLRLQPSWLQGCGPVEFAVDLPGISHWPTSTSVPAPHLGKIHHRQNLRLDQHE